MNVCCRCCVIETGRSLAQSSPTDLDVCVCVCVWLNVIKCNVALYHIQSHTLFSNPLNLQGVGRQRSE